MRKSTLTGSTNMNRKLIRRNSVMAAGTAIVASTIMPRVTRNQPMTLNPNDLRNADEPETNISGTWIIITIAILSSLTASSEAADRNADCIKPYPRNARYWQYQGQPVMLLGGSKTDHIFLADDLESHLDEIRTVGANYVRCTMSQREGQDLKPHKLLPNGKFDLDQWNEGYWKRFADCLKWCGERDIIIQIEVWDRFDFSTKSWETSSWNAGNNVNYTNDQSALAAEYPQHPAGDLQPFFHSIKGMPRYDKRLDLIRNYQEAFVAKMLSYSLEFGNVLYCMNNETSTPAKWGQYWIEFIKTKATGKGVTVCTTDMFDDAFDADKAKHTPIIFKDAKHYMFADISQVNSRVYDDTHWERLQLLLRLVNTHPRPTNHVKIYDGGYTSWGSGAPEDGIERFWRDILAGSASVRFHRPGPHGGRALNHSRSSSIKAARILESRIHFWDITPHMGLLSDRESNEAYLAAKPGEHYALYFTHGGSVGLDLTDAAGTFDITWISVSQGITVDTTAAKLYGRTPKTLNGGRIVTLSAPYKGGWVAALVKK